jgi:hypothetical protein
MKLENEMRPLPARTLRFSKRMVALSLALIGGGAGLVMSDWHYAMVTGVCCAAVGFVIFFTAGYYWACDNESCG